MDEQTILSLVKEFCTVDDEELSYNVELLIMINQTISNLSDVGVVEFTEFVVVEDTEFPVFESVEIKAIATLYLCLRVREIFDPSINTVVTQSTSNVLSELEQRLIIRHQEGGDDDG